MAMKSLENVINVAIPGPINRNLVQVPGHRHILLDNTPHRRDLVAMRLVI